jgi:hypothetical protein
MPSAFARSLAPSWPIALLEKSKVRKVSEVVAWHSPALLRHPVHMTLKAGLSPSRIVTGLTMTDEKMVQVDLMITPVWCNQSQGVASENDCNRLRTNLAF